MTSLNSSTPQFLAPITRLESVAPHHFLMSLHAPTLAFQARAGQFVHVLSRESLQYDPLLRRAFSILAARPELPQPESPKSIERKKNIGNGEIDILFRIEGAATQQLSKREIGSILDIIGPLGRPFDLKLFHVKQSGSEAKKRPVLVGGGVGVPPLIFLGSELKRASLEPLMLIGARKAEEILGLTHLEELSIEARLATEDGSLGILGRVTQLLETALQNEAQNGVQAVVYACGPLPMLKAVAKVAESFGVPCQVSMEENMPCGIGVCNGCVVPMKVSGDSQGSQVDYERYQRVCVAGPAIWSSSIDWEAL